MPPMRQWWSKVNLLSHFLRDQQIDDDTTAAMDKELDQNNSTSYWLTSQLSVYLYDVPNEWTYTQ